ncbi:MAG: type II toxin-antitoxin system VapC family toxin [Armatimonadota bacterium]
MIFLDTSGIFALADQDDEKHVEALAMLDKAQLDGELLLIHSYVIVESAALLQRRLSAESALSFLEDTRNFEVRWVADDLHAEAVNILKVRGKSRLSLVDAVSFLVMRQENVTDYLGFDKHFQAEGFRQIAS